MLDLQPSYGFWCEAYYFTIMEGACLHELLLLKGRPTQRDVPCPDPPPAEVQKLHGFKGAYTFENRENGKAMLITLWESESDLRASAEAVKPIREETVLDSGGKPHPQVEEFEVLYHPDLAPKSMS